MNRTILPLLALALLVSSTELRAEDFPFKVGDSVRAVFVSGTSADFKVTNIKGKWIEGSIVAVGLTWFNSDHFGSVFKLQPQ
jgi:hypothetical protein